ncbi:MAG: hypothetical protein HYX75_24115 [Acidobacteria bacterium]|nr:hypothetical protein [Acidobacteriota bacterium]
MLLLFILAWHDLWAGENATTSRAVRVEFDGAHYDVMARGVGRAAVFPDDEDRRNCLANVGKLVEAGKGEKLVSVS